jgi:hypothetical protein
MTTKQKAKVKQKTKVLVKPLAKSLAVKSPKPPVSNRISGQMLIDFMFRNGLSQMGMCQLFGISISRLNSIYADPEKFVHEPVTCYVYRQYIAHPELIGDDSIDIAKFYESIGGKDAISGTEFSLIMGRELSAYVRWFAGSRPSASVKKLLQNAMKLNGQDSRKAFDSIKELCKQEGLSRGIDVLSQRDWRDHDVARVRKTVKKKEVAGAKSSSKPTKRQG